MSPSTVSHVLNGTASISASTKKRILASVEELGYRPNANARALRQLHSHLLGVIFPDISSEYYASCTAGIIQQARRHNYVVLANDLHFDNMIANAEDPIFFDIETLTFCYAKLKDNVENLKLPFDVTNTIILPLRNTEGLFDVGLSAIYTGDTSSKKMSNLLLKPDEENDWVYESSSLKMNASQNLC